MPPFFSVLFMFSFPVVVPLHSEIFLSAHFVFTSPKCPFLVGPVTDKYLPCHPGADRGGVLGFGPLFGTLCRLFNIGSKAGPPLFAYKPKLDLKNSSSAPGPSQRGGRPQTGEARLNAAPPRRVGTTFILPFQRRELRS